MKYIFAPFLALAVSFCLPVFGQDIIINEIMYNTPSANPAEEWIELYNRGTNPVNLAGWRISDGVDYTFPAVTIAPGGYLLVAANVETFQNLHPAVSNVIGGWVNTLSNNGEGVELADATGERVNRVRYATDGDWGTRRRGPLDNG